ncbi:MAG: ribosome maturation factor RimM [Pseudomonadota bacterium]
MCLGVVASPHGVRGAFRVKTFTEAPEGLTAYGPLSDEDGRRTFALSIVRVLRPDLVLCTCPQAPDRTAAEALRGVKLYVDRDRLPDPSAGDDEDAFYHEDLVGLAAVSPEGAPLGRVTAVFNFGAGDVLELADVPGRKGRLLVPFTRAAVPEVRLDAREVVVDLSSVDPASIDPSEPDSEDAD